ncbi:chloramphenicol acetyltransferase [Hymenobacter saemangeumensis]|uniref:Chloramphenicol acetyltransferase n=1 Tax=Hymenobacter saemangeumensis TaxID=1084522 RepID=A0ABP8IAF9_9BACT
MKQLIDLATWPRREHYEFFSAFEEPFFGLQAEVDCSAALAEAKRLGVPFFLYYLHCTLLAANAVEELRCRVVDGQVVRYDRVHASPTIGRADHTFGFAFVEAHETLAAFVAAAEAEIAAVQQSSGLRLNEHTSRPDTIHCSAIPWVKFTGLSHARSFRYPDSCPKISYGKLYELGAVRLMPVSVHVHHGLADGYQVGLFLEKFQELLG